MRPASHPTRYSVSIFEQKNFADNSNEGRSWAKTAASAGTPSPLRATPPCQGESLPSRQPSFPRSRPEGAGWLLAGRLGAANSNNRETRCAPAIRQANHISPFAMCVRENRARPARFRDSASLARNDGGRAPLRAGWDELTRPAQWPSVCAPQALVGLPTLLKSKPRTRSKPIPQRGKHSDTDSKRPAPKRGNDRPPSLSYWKTLKSWRGSWRYRKRLSAGLAWKVTSSASRWRG